MSILLDTNVCIATMNKRPPQVRERFIQARSRGDEVAISSISIFELWYGIAGSIHTQKNIAQLAEFRTTVLILPFDEDDGRAAGELRGVLRRSGKPIGTYDYLIAGQALRRGLLLITANVGEFSRVKGLRWENWEA